MRCGWRSGGQLLAFIVRLVISIKNLVNNEKGGMGDFWKGGWE